MRKTLIGMAAIVLIGGLGIIACSTPAAEEPTSTAIPTVEPTSTPAPAAEPSETDSTTEATQGPPIDLPVGETHEIALDSNPTTGYGWQVEYNDWDLELVEQRYEPESDVVGAGGKEVFVFRGRTVSSGDVVFTYKRSWEDEILKTERYTIDVLAGRFEEMSLSEAMTIASESECADAGPLMENASYNKFTGTWWIDVDAQKEFCPSPACVVNMATKQAEINWRCTGALPPEDEATEPVDIDEPTPESGVFFPQQEPPVGPRVSMVALFFGELVEVDGCLRARDAHDDYLVIWPHDHSLNVEDDRIQILDEAGEAVVEVGDQVRLSGGEAMSVSGDEKLRDVVPAHCPGRFWIVGTEVDRLQDVLLDVQNVVERPDGTRVRVRGHLVASNATPARLCRILLESDPPQCGELSLQLEGFDLDAFQGLENYEGVTWSPGFVELTGVVQDGVLTVD